MKAYTANNRATGEVIRSGRRPIYSRCNDCMVVASQDSQRNPGRFVEVREYTLGKEGHKVIATFDKGMVQ
ncbi:hypothetical protein HOR51_gp26 [Ralstonia phage phiAp1]|uniref:Uncharacterized protein n=1 Tax=Ralstonia phage phiAp1 TaxID=2783867 RepID=A0A1L7DS44_9CAUD|nr:hypothetical protein HOR51_gp26 [Ralstonia phage phiAp1]APU03167.1 hypothetical protein phiAp1_26 [Ralstonia phage phiAp1]